MIDSLTELCLNMSMKEKDFLKNIGLTDTESEIYYALLAYDGLSASALVKETSIQRTTIYHALETLEHKGLVFKRLQSGKQNYSANSPKNLQRYLDHQIDSIEVKKQSLETHLPQLLKLSKEKPDALKVSQSEGLEGVKNIIEEALYCHSREWQIIAPSKNFFSEFDKDYAKYFLKTRVENKISARSLWESTKDKRILTDLEIKRRNPRILPPVMHGRFKSVILLFDNKIAFIPPLKEKTALLIQSQELHDTMLAVFEGLWLDSKPYKAANGL